MCRLRLPLNPALTQSEFEFYLRDLDARALLVEADDDSPSVAAAESLQVPVIRVEPSDSAGAFTFDLASELPSAAAPAVPEDVALVLHTSGTTGRPKMVPLTHANLMASADNVAQTLELEQHDCCLNVMPLFHIHGLVAALLASLSSGGTVICTTGFHGPSFFQWLTTLSPTWYTAVPTMHQTVVQRAKTDGAPEHRLRFARSSSASLAPQTLAELETLLKVPVVEAYGMTEAAHQIASSPVTGGRRRTGSVGPSAGPEVGISDENGTAIQTGGVGEIVVRGPNVTAGYLGQGTTSGSFYPGGWFRTGDQGYLDEAGYLFLTGRLKEIINRGGETIAPRHIDEAILSLPGVRQAVAFAVADPALGQEVAAAVLLEAGSEETEEHLQAQLMDLLAYARVPKRIVFVDEIPKGPTGKLQRIGLADKLGITTIRPSPIGAVEASEDRLNTVESIWLSVLELSSVGHDQAFLESGGDSISATALAVAIESEFNIDLPLMAFYNAATIREQTHLIASLLDDDASSQ